MTAAISTVKGSGDALSILFFFLLSMLSSVSEHTNSQIMETILKTWMTILTMLNTAVSFALSLSFYFLKTFLDKFLDILHLKTFLKGTSD